MLKRYKRVLFIAAAVVLAAAIIVLCLLQSGWMDSTDAEHRQQIERMAAYLNEKYGYQLTEADCVYFRQEDYHVQQPPVGYGVTYDIPYIAIFQKDDVYITATDRNGFLGDDHQLAELNTLLCDYFEKTTGLDIYFVEVRTASNGNLFDMTLNKILHEQFNEKLTQDNIAQFVEYIWNTDSLQLNFYFTAQEDVEMQIQKITWKLGKLEQHKNLKSLRFYISDMESPHIYYAKPIVHLQSEENNSREYSYTYVMGSYHVINEVEHIYPTGESVYHPVEEFNSFVAGGYYIMDRGYSGGFGDRQITKINQFGVVDLSEEKPNG